MLSKQEQIAALSKEIWGKKQELQKLRLENETQKVDNYSFTTFDGTTVTLAELFGDKQDLILIHNMGKGCSYCTMWADGFQSSLAHLENRAAFVVTSPDDPETQKAFAESRGWTFSIVSADRDGFIKDMGFSDGQHVMPGVSAFHKDAQGNIFRTNKDFFGPNDDYNPVWNLFDLLKDGSTGWEPKYHYS